MLGQWSDFYVAITGAAAALAGLLFVAVSINLNRMLEFPNLVALALETLAVLVMTLIVGVFGLIPGQSHIAVSLELGVTGLIGWGFFIFTLMRYPQRKHWPVAHILMNQLPAPFLVTAGVLIWLKHESGPYWVVPAVMISFVASVIRAWIMLVEIQR